MSEQTAPYALGGNRVRDLPDALAPDTEVIVDDEVLIVGGNRVRDLPIGQNIRDAYRAIKGEKTKIYIGDLPEDCGSGSVENQFEVVPYPDLFEKEPAHNGHHANLLVVNNAYEVRCVADCPGCVLFPGKQRFDDIQVSLSGRTVSIVRCTTCSWVPKVEGV